jgi:hypothetical protein
MTATAVFLVACVAIWLATRALAGDDHDTVVALVLVAFAARVAAAMALHVYLLPTNGALFYDDAGYIDTATTISESWRRGTQAWVDPSLDNEYVDLAAGIFYALGPSVSSLKIVNCALGVGAAVLAYRTVQITHGRAPLVALGAMLLFPSLVLWSLLALKDSYSLFFMMLATWGVAELCRSGRWQWYAVTFVAIGLLATVRSWLFFILVALWPLGVFLASRTGRWRRAATAVLACGVLLATTEAVPRLAPNVVTLPSYIRAAMAAGARTAFVEGPPAYAEAGLSVTVEVPGRTSAPDPRTVTVAPGTELVVVGDLSNTPPPRSSGRPFAYVRAGDVVVIAQPGAPAATAPPPGRAITVNPATGLVVTTPPPADTDGASLSGSVAENLSYLPYGVAIALTAPTPLHWDSLRDALTLVEMIPWYAALLLAALGGFVMLRRRALPNAYGLLVGVAVLLVLALIEGNVGTLMRHRGMLIPHVVMLAALGAAHLWPRLDPSGRVPAARPAAPTAAPRPPAGARA